MCVGGEAGYHPISTLHMDMLGSAGTAAAAGTISSASLGGGGGTPSSMSAAAASTYGLSGLMHGTAGIAGVAATAGPPVKIGKTSSGIAAGAHKNSPAQAAAAVCPPPLAMSWLATNLELDLASAFYLNYSRLTGAGNATLLQVGICCQACVWRYVCVCGGGGGDYDHTRLSSLSHSPSSSFILLGGYQQPVHAGVCGVMCVRKQYYKKDRKIGIHWPEKATS